MAIPMNARDTSSAGSTAMDPVTLAVLRGRLAPIADEMDATQPLGIVLASNQYVAKTPIFSPPHPPAVPRRKSQEVLRRNGV
jgi:hypothetical protein